MKKEDKLLLLTELLGTDTSFFLKDKQKDFLNCDIMITISNLLKENKESKSPKYLNAQNEFIKLKNTKLVSIEQYFSCIAKANRILKLLQRKEYINPLMCSENERDVLLSKLIINFDGKDISLGDLVMLETYSDSYKIDAVKNLVINWKKEVDDTFIRPVQLLLTYPKNLPIKRIIPVNKIFISILLVILNILIVSTFFIRDKYIYSILHFDYQNYYISIPYLLLCILVFIYDFSFTFLLLKRNNEHRTYFFAQKNILFNSRKVLKKIDNNTIKIYKKIINCIILKNEIKGSVKSYSISDKYLYALEYIKEENEKPSLSEDHVSSYEIVLIELIFILLVYFTVLLVFYNMGAN